MLAIGAFAGVREAEIKRLNWTEVDQRRGHIEIKSSKAKSARRRIVEMQPNLREWLRPYAGMTGRLVPVNARKKLDAIREMLGWHAGRRMVYATHSPRIVWLRFTMRRVLLRSWGNKSADALLDLSRTGVAGRSRAILEDHASC